MGGGDAGLAVRVLGLLTVAAGPLSVGDLAALSSGADGSSADHTRQVRHIVTMRAARSWRRSDQTGTRATSSRTTRCCSTPRRTMTSSTRSGGIGSTGGPSSGATVDGPRRRTPPPRRPGIYSTTTPPRSPGSRSDWPPWSATPAGSTPRSGRSASTTSWPICAGPPRPDRRPSRRDARRRPRTGSPVDPSHPLDQPGYVCRQLWMQAAELAEDALAGHFRARLESEPGPPAALAPLWTTRRISRAFVRELGRHDGRVRGVAAFPDGRVVTAGADGRVLLWEPAEVARMVMAARRRQFGSNPVELGRQGPGLYGGGTCGRAGGDRRPRPTGLGSCRSRLGTGRAPPPPE